MTRRTECRRRRRSGLTLVELVLSIVVISVAVVGTMLAVNASVAHSADPMIQHQAAAIAEAYLAEVLSRSYVDPDDGTTCSAPEATRDLYDDICDYAGLDDLGARDQQNAPVFGLEAYRVRVAVDPNANLNGLVGSAEVLRVDVRVTWGSLVDLTLSGYRRHP